MGKDNLLIGTARGKLGDIVFYRTGGEQRFRTRVRPTNPRTNAQLLQRCVVSTAVKAYSPLITVCDHAFQNYVGPLKNHQRFMRLNIKKLREVALSLVSSWSPIKWKSYNLGNWALKDDTNIPINSLVVSEGDLPTIYARFGAYSSGANEAPGINLNADPTSSAVEAMTYQSFCDTFGLSAGDQLTFILQTNKQDTGYVDRTFISRIILMPSNGNMQELMFTKYAGTTGIYTLNLPNAENYGSTYFKTTDYSTILHVLPYEKINDLSNIGSFAIITSRFENNMWRRSNSELIVNPDIADIETLQSAVASYLKADTSSLYLNQATTGEQQALEARTIEMLESNIEIAEEEADEEAAQAKKRQKRK